MVTKGQTATAEEVKARWAYSELNSPRFKPLYAGRGPIRLRKMARQGKPFSAVSGSDWPVLEDMLFAARPLAVFVGAVDYVCEGWTRSRLESIWALWAFNPPAKRLPICYADFHRDSPNTGPGMQPNESDPRVAINSVTIPDRYEQDEFVVIVTIWDSHLLLDGYLRSLMFMRSPYPAAELLAWVPR